MLVLFCFSPSARLRRNKYGPVDAYGCAANPGPLLVSGHITRQGMPLHLGLSFAPRLY